MIPNVSESTRAPLLQTSILAPFIPFQTQVSKITSKNNSPVTSCSIFSKDLPPERKTSQAGPTQPAQPRLPYSLPDAQAYTQGHPCPASDVTSLLPKDTLPHLLQVSLITVYKAQLLLPLQLPMSTTLTTIDHYNAF